MLALCSCERSGGVLPQRSARPTRANVLLITIDTLRADHVGVYGARDAETPTLDALAAGGVRFDVAITPAPLTLPAHASLLSALDPPRHGIRHNGLHRLDDALITLTERLHDVGFATEAVVASVALHHRHGLDQGFDRYDDAIGAEERGDLGYLERSATRVNELAIAALRRLPRPFFLWLHYYDVHASYRPPEPFASRHLGRPYDGEIAFVDAAIGELLDALHDAGELDDTLVALTADHGESLGQHGEATHSYTLHDGVLRVPLVLAGPGLPRGTVVPDVVRLVDVAPTLLARLGLPPTPGSDGMDLSPRIAGIETPVPAAYAETLATRIDHGWGELRALRTGRWLYLRAPRRSLFDVRTDPAQARDLLREPDATPHAEAQRLDADLDARLESGDRSAPALAFDARARAQLRALGYALPSTPDEAPAREVVAASAAIDPRDGLRALSGEFALGAQAFGAGDFATAERHFSLARVALPRSAQLRGLLGTSLLWLGRSAEAIAVLQEATALAPEVASFHALESACRHLGGDDAGAARSLDAALALDPDDPWARLGSVWRALRAGDLAGADAHAERALALDPRGRLLRLQLAALWSEHARPERARVVYQALLARHPDFAPARDGLARLAAAR